MMKTVVIKLALLIVLVASNALAVERKVPASESEVLLSFSPLVKKTSPAVVNIYTKKKVKIRRFSPFMDDPLFKHFFGDSFAGKERERVESSLGSGVIVRDDGFVITSNHVISGADEITVILSDKREFSAKKLIVDEKTDLALLKVDPGKEKLPFVELMNSDELEVGDMVLAIGNPFGVGQTVTSGIVSAVARTTIGVTDYQFFIQTDAAINPGNSGGALVNMQGKLAGINSAIFSKSGGSNGIGFAIPANMVATIINSSSVGDRVVRPWIGTSMQAVTQDIANSLGLKKPVGALISQLHPKGPAAEAGLLVGDVIIELDKIAINDEHELRFRVATYKIGSVAKMKYIRAGRVGVARVKMIPPIEEPARDLRTLKGRNPFSGSTVANLSPALSDEFGLGMFNDGVVVISTPNKSSFNIGLRKRDIIVSINGADIKSTQQLEELLKSDKSSGWNIAIKRGGRVLKIKWSGR